MKRYLAAAAALLALAARPAGGAGGRSPVWEGTINAPRLWRCMDLVLGPDGAVSEIRVGTATDRQTFPARESRVETARLSFVAEIGGATFVFSGERREDELSGTVKILRRDRTLTEGRWKARLFRPFPETAERVLRRVRARLHPAGEAGLEVVERPVEPRDHAIVRRFAPDGRYDVSDGGAAVRGFDGQEFWTANAISGAVTPDRRMEAKLRLGDEFRSFSWARPGGNADRRWSVSEIGYGTGRRIVLSGSDAAGIVPLRIFVSPSSWKPERAEIEWDAGPYEITFSAFRNFGGVVYPSHISTSYREQKSEFEASARLSPRGARAGFSRPRPAWKASFDPDVPARVDARREKEVSGHFFAAAKIGDSESGWFLLDTGAPFVLLDEKIADRMGLPVEEVISIGTIRRLTRLRVGSLTLENLPVVCRDLSKMSAPEGAPRAGVLGMPFFSEAVVGLAADGTAVTVADPAGPPPPGAAWEPLLVRDAPWIRAGIAGKPEEWFRLDTGKSGAVSVMSAIALQWGLPENSGRESGNATVEGDTVELPLTLPDFEIGDRRLGELAAARKLPGTPNDDVDGTGGWIGRGAFEGKTLTIDCRNRRYAVEGFPRFSASSSQPRRSRSGGTPER